MNYSRAAKRKQDKKHKRKLKKLYKMDRCIRTGVYLVDEQYPYKTVHKPYYAKTYKSGCLHVCKKVLNRKVRHFNGELPTKGNSYKKLATSFYQLY